MSRLVGIHVALFENRVDIRVGMGMIPHDLFNRKNSLAHAVRQGGSSGAGGRTRDHLTQWNKNLTQTQRRNEGYGGRQWSQQRRNWGGTRMGGERRGGLWTRMLRRRKWKGGAEPFIECFVGCDAFKAVSLKILSLWR